MKALPTFQPPFVFEDTLGTSGTVKQMHIPSILLSHQASIMGL